MKILVLKNTGQNASVATRTIGRAAAIRRSVLNTVPMKVEKTAADKTKDNIIIDSVTKSL